MTESAGGNGADRRHRVSKVSHFHCLLITLMFIVPPLIDT